MKSHYQVLGVPETSSEEEIKKAYRRMARENHPDMHPGDAAKEARFKEASEAYETLGDPEKRKQYDLERAERPRAASRGKKRAAPKNPFDFTAMNFDDVFEDIYEKPKSEEVPKERGRVDVDGLFSQFMGFKPR